MGEVGIIANPASGKDIRRLVAYGTVFDNQEKINIVRRVILSLASLGIKKIMYMPEYHGIVPKAFNSIYEQHRPNIELIEAWDSGVLPSYTQNDTKEAVAFMAQHKIKAIITLGGDGTNRLTAKECRNIPILPISTGTNNVFPTMIEGTIAGLAAGVVAKGLAGGPSVIKPSKKLEIYKNSNLIDIALIDIVALNDSFIGSRAVWDSARIKRVIVTRGQADNIGISSIAGNLAPVGVEESRGLDIITANEPGEENYLLSAPLAPGLIEKISVKSYQYIKIGESVKIMGPCILALDGEREVEVQESELAQIKLTFDGPKVIDASEVLKEAVLKGYSLCRH